jgi:general secretion pathway protein E
MSLRLPYAWARTHRALIHSSTSGPVLTVSSRTPAWAVDEIRRRHGELPRREVSDPELDTLLAATYAQTGDAAAVVDAAANEINLDRLMQDIPEIED